MKAIFKYSIPTTDNIFSIEMSSDPKFLDAQVQYGSPCIWVEVNLENKYEEYYFKIFNTGAPIEDTFKGKYLGTYQMNEGLFVFHLFLINNN